MTKVEQNTLSDGIIISYTIGVSKSDENSTKHIYQLRFIKFLFFSLRRKWADNIFSDGFLNPLGIELS